MDGRDTSPTGGVKYHRGTLETGLVGHRARGLSPSSGATTPWTATTVGSAPSSPGTRSSAARGRSAPIDPRDAIAPLYAEGTTDEFLPAMIFDPPPGRRSRAACARRATWCSSSTFAPTAPRQLSAAFLDENFSTGFERVHWPQRALRDADSVRCQLTTCPHAFPPQTLDRILGEVVSGAGMKLSSALRRRKNTRTSAIFSTAAWRQPFPGEDRKMVPSPKVATYDLQPEMSAAEVTADRS